MACLCHCRHCLWVDRRADGQLMGLSRIHCVWLQIGNRTSTWCALLHAGCQYILTISERYVTGSTDGQPSIGTAECGLYILLVPYHHASCQETDWSFWRFHHGFTGHQYRDMWHGRGLGLHIQRHLLVFGCRSRGLRLLKFPDRPDVLADSEMGRAG